MGTIGITVLGLIGLVGVLLFGGLIWGIGSSAGWGKKKELPQPGRQHRPYAYLDAGETPDAKTVKRILDAYEDDDVVGTYARASLDDLSEVTRRRSAIMQIVDAEFEPHSMTWERYCAPLETAFEAVVANAAQMANLLQAFDSTGYARLERMERGGVLEGKRNELEQLDLARQSLERMDGLKDANRRVLVELERLQQELAQLSGSDLAGKTDEIADEIERLAKEAKYYG